jgi:hypothetical protein
MKSDSQYVRWGIPGWTLFIAFFLFSFIDSDPTIFKTITSLFVINDKGESFWVILFAGVLTAGAGIPIGYIIYQIYFYLRWVSPISRNGFLPPAINGRMVEMEDSLRDIDKDKLGFNKTWRNSIINETSDHRTFWYYISPLLHETIVEIDKNDVYSKHLNYLKEAMHSLGANSLGMLFGYTFYIILKWQAKELTLLNLFMVLTCTSLNFFFLYVGEQSRRKQKVKGKHITDSQAEIFISMLIFVFVALNPNINNEFTHYVLEIFLIILGVIWGWSAKEDRKIIWPIVGLTTIISYVLLKVNETNSFVQYINWSVALSALIFSAIIIAFVKTKQNTVNALTLYQYYLICLLAEKRKKKIWKKPRATKAQS